eukprot:363114-Chlamydomonas_euryale.AAC.2
MLTNFPHAHGHGHSTCTRVRKLLAAFHSGLVRVSRHDSPPACDLDLQSLIAQKQLLMAATAVAGSTGMPVMQISFEPRRFIPQIPRHPAIPRHSAEPTSICQDMHQR